MNEMNNTPDGLREALIKAFSSFTWYTNETDINNVADGILTAIAPHLPAPTVAGSEAAEACAREIHNMFLGSLTGYKLPENYAEIEKHDIAVYTSVIRRHFPSAPAKEDSEMIDWLWHKGYDLVESDGGWYISGPSTGPTDPHANPRAAMQAAMKEDRT